MRGYGTVEVCCILLFVPFRERDALFESLTKAGSSICIVRQRLIHSENDTENSIGGLHNQMLCSLSTTGREPLTAGVASFEELINKLFA